MSLLVLVFSTLVLCAPVSSKLAGHLQPLGSHKDPFGVTMIGKFSTPSVFYHHFVDSDRPLWMMSALDSVDHPGLGTWNDTFFRKNFKMQQVKVEMGKKENRERNTTWLPFHEFLRKYKYNNMYMVHTLDENMKELILIPPSLQCGGFQKVLQEAVLWLGSGTTQSVLHYDKFDNLLCLLDGKKRVVLIDKKYKPDVEADGFVASGGYSKVDVEKVDMKKFPRLANVDWHRVTLNKGDCLFIPQGWYHQVNSSTERHLAYNLWFSRLQWFDTTDCTTSENPSYEPFVNIARFGGFASPNELYRSELLEKIRDKGPMFQYEFDAAIDTSTKERRAKFFEAVDQNGDDVLSWRELYGFDIDKAVMKFPDIFGFTSDIPSTDETVVLYEPLEYNYLDDSDIDMEEDDDRTQTSEGKEQTKKYEQQIEEESRKDMSSLEDKSPQLPLDRQIDEVESKDNIHSAPSVPDGTVEASQRTEHDESEHDSSDQSKHETNKYTDGGHTTSPSYSEQEEDSQSSQTKKKDEL